MNIGFIGLGKLGLPCAAAMSVKTGSVVRGYDLNPAVKSYVAEAKIPYQELLCEQYLQDAQLVVEDTVQDVVDQSDIIFFAVQTPHDPDFEGVQRVPNDRKDFSYDYLSAAVSSVRDALLASPEKHLTLVVISTVLPGTMRDVILPILEPVISRIKFCYNPYFIAMGTTISDFLNPEFVLVGEANPGDAALLLDIYSLVHTAPIRIMKIESAELTKVAYNTFIGFKIVFANTIAEIVEQRGGDVDEITDALAQANVRLMSGKYLRAGMGDGGGCHPRDQIAMSWLAKELQLSTDIFEYLAIARDSQTDNQASIIETYANSSKLPVQILGQSYKPDINLMIGSPAVLLSNLLKERGIEHSVYDPHALPDSQLAETASVFFVGTNHTLFKKLTFPAGSVVIDPWGDAVAKSEKWIQVTPGRPL